MSGLLSEDVAAIKAALAAGPTPGPWRWFRNEACVGPLKGSFILAGNVRVADVLSRPSGSQETCEANASLMALCHPERMARLIDALENAAVQPEASRPDEPDHIGGVIDMVLHCPKCGLQHVDAPEPGQLISGGPNAGRVRAGWENPPHRSHLCHRCGHIWRPADVHTNGVLAVKTSGKADSPIAPPTEAAPTNEGSSK